jgi:DNA mismatch repair protein MutL
VDVNIHPRKTEVRFDDPGMIFRFVNHSVRAALEQTLQGELKARFSSLRDSTDYPTVGVERFSKPSVGEPLSRPGHEKHSMQSSLLFTQNLLKPIEKETSHLTPNPERNDFQVIQIMNTYLVTENETEMLIIDQHAAAERITFEKILARFEKDENLKSQMLLLPETISLSEQDLLRLKSNIKNIRRLGFELEFKDSKISITAVPEILANKELMSVFQQILNDIESNSKKEDTEILHKIIATLACHSSIRAGQRIGEEQARYFVTNLLKCRQPYSCPHGRPIIWTLSKNELEKNFKRKL